MAAYELTKGADNDLQAIARYTVKTWGAKQARRYGDLLEKHFKALGRKRVQTRVFLKHRPELLVSEESILVRHHHRN